MKRFIAMSLLFSIACSMGARGYAQEGIGRLVFDVKLGIFNMGETVIEYVGPVVRDGVEQVLVRVITDTGQLKDTEEIYAEKGSLLPLYIKRKVSYLGKYEEIEEFYDQAKKTVIIKNGDDTIVLDNEDPVDNVFLFMLRILKDNPDITKSLPPLNLPKLRLDILATDKSPDIKYNGKRFDTYLLYTSPAKLKIWLSKDDYLPLRVSGAIPVIPYSLFLKEADIGFLRGE